MNCTLNYRELYENLKSQEIDAVITPTINLELPIVGSFVKGADILPKLIDTFNTALYIWCLVSIISILLMPFCTRIK